MEKGEGYFIGSDDLYIDAREIAYAAIQGNEITVVFKGNSVPIVFRGMNENERHRFIKVIGQAVLDNKYTG